MTARLKKSMTISFLCFKKRVKKLIHVHPFLQIMTEKHIWIESIHVDHEAGE